ncbi:MAG: hypothetical protein J6S13_01300 [Clostridia bacterium]|nr:hypothetical protein [Clostridia bacterium]
MLSSIEDLWFGEIEPVKTIEQGNEEIKELEGLIQRNREELRKQLTKDANERFEKYADCFEEYLSIVSKSAFSEGFKLGARFVVEVLR